MRKIVFSNPPRLVFGAGAINDFVADYLDLGFHRLFVLTIDVLKETLAEAFSEISQKGVSVQFNTVISAEPTFHDLNALIEEARSFGADSVAAIGGGSVLDVAKMVAAMLTVNESPKSFVGIGLIKKRDTYLACLPSTAGTGSEVSPNAIFLDEIDGGKKGVISRFLVPDAAYIDPMLTMGVPPSVTAATGLDALAHCLEAYVNNFSHPIVDLYALDGVRLISKNLLSAVRNGYDVEARTALALGSLYGGMCLGPVNTTAVHALAYPLGSSFKIAHGLSNALLLPYVMEFNLDAAVGRYAEIALAMGAEKHSSELETAKEGISIIRQLIKDCGVPSRMSEIGIPFDEIEGIASEAMEVQRLLKNNIKKVTLDDAVSIYKKAY
jgi:alcohol dehydrogenase